MDYLWIIIIPILIYGLRWSWKYKPKKTIDKAEGVMEQVRRFEKRGRGHYEQFRKKNNDK